MIENVLTEGMLYCHGVTIETFNVLTIGHRKRNRLHVITSFLCAELVNAISEHSHLICDLEKTTLAGSLSPMVCPV